MNLQIICCCCCYVLGLFWDKAMHRHTILTMLLCLILLSQTQDLSSTFLVMEIQVWTVANNFKTCYCLSQDCSPCSQLSSEVGCHWPYSQLDSSSQLSSANGKLLPFLGAVIVLPAPPCLASQNCHQGPSFSPSLSTFAPQEKKHSESFIILGLVR